MRRERLYRTEGIVLREMDYGEADRILTLLTPGGKLSAIARGIRRPTSRKVGHLGLFYRAQMMLARGRELDTITQALKDYMKTGALPPFYSEIAIRRFISYPKCYPYSFSCLHQAK